MKGPYYLPLTTVWIDLLQVEYLISTSSTRRKFLGVFYLLSYYKLVLKTLLCLVDPTISVMDIF